MKKITIIIMVYFSIHHRASAHTYFQKKYFWFLISIATCFMFIYIIIKIAAASNAMLYSSGNRHELMHLKSLHIWHLVNCQPHTGYSLCPLSRSIIGNNFTRFSIEMVLERRREWRHWTLAFAKSKATLLPECSTSIAVESRIRI